MTKEEKRYILSEDTKKSEGEESERKGTYDPRNKMNNLTSSEWVKETISVYVQKGLGAGHEDAKIERMHPAPFSFQDVARLINFFSKKGEIVLDPFSGIGSTLKACALNDRIGYGIELNKKFHDLAKIRLKKEVHETLFKRKEQNLIHGDALEKIRDFEKEYFDFLVTSPPYWNILDTVDHKAKKERIEKGYDTKYSEDKKDLANIESYEEFIKILGDFFDSCSDILKPKKYMAIIVSDFRKKEKYYMFHSDLANYIESKGNFKIKGVKVLYQRHKKVMPYGYPYSYVPNIHHQYILILQKNGTEK